jgi:acylphosphatase
MIRRYHVLVTGKVQDVWFRGFTDSVANLMGLNGTAENKETNHVEIFVEGKDNIIKRFLACISFGPYAARVDNLELQEQAVTGEIGFHAIFPRHVTAEPVVIPTREPEWGEDGTCCFCGLNVEDNQPHHRIDDKWLVHDTCPPHIPQFGG